MECMTAHNMHRIRMTESITVGNMLRRSVARTTVGVCSGKKSTEVTTVDRICGKGLLDDMGYGNVRFVKD